MTDKELHELENVACPGAGACGGQYTANTMSTVMEMIGLSPMGFNSVPAMDPQKDQVAFRLRQGRDESCCRREFSRATF